MLAHIKVMVLKLRSTVCDAASGGHIGVPYLDENPTAGNGGQGIYCLFVTHIVPTWTLVRREKIGRQKLQSQPDMSGSSTDRVTTNGLPPGWHSREGCNAK